MKTTSITKQKALENFRDLTARLSAGGDWVSDGYAAEMRSRKICCTPFSGCYGLAGWILATNGTPPRCEILVNNSSRWTPIAITNGTPRRLGARHAKIVQRFVEAWLLDRNEAFEIDGEST